MLFNTKKIPPELGEELQNNLTRRTVHNKKKAVFPDLSLSYLTGSHFANE
jgi:hypothetical protein